MATGALRILLLSRYARLGASSRVRFFQYLPYLESNNVHVDISPLFDDAYLRRMYSGSAVDWLEVAKSYRNRVSALRRAAQYDLIWLEYEALPWLPAWFERALGLGRYPYIVDYDDAIFHRYDLNRNPLVRVLLRNKIDQIMARAKLVSAGNRYLAARALSAGAKNVEVLPTVVDVERYQVRFEPQPEVITIGWIGSPSTQRYLELVLGAISDLHRGGAPIRLLVVGGKLEGYDQLPVVNVPWAEANEVGVIQTFDVGIMPLLDSPWEQGKCGYKLIQYMACGKPVVASAVGVNRDIVEHGINGFLATTEGEWSGFLLQLIKNPLLRRKMGKKGREKVEREYSLQVTAAKVLDYLITSCGKD